MSFRRLIMQLWSAALLILITAVSMQAQENAEYKPHIHTLYGNVKNRLFFIPNKSDVFISWSDYQKGNNDIWSPTSVRVFDRYSVSFMNGQDTSTIFRTEVDSLSLLIPNVELGKSFLIQVIGHIDGEGDDFPSKFASIFTGVSSSPPQNGEIGSGSGTFYYLFFVYARWPFQMASLVKPGAESYFTESSIIGKIAFQAIWLFFLCGLLIWFRGCIRYIRPKQIFPIGSNVEMDGEIGDESPRLKKVRGKKNKFIEINWKSSSDKEESHITSEIVDIIKRWKGLIKGLNDKRRGYILKNTDANQDQLDQIYTEYWAKGGYQKIHKLITRIESSETLKENPTAKIILAGLRNHEIGGLNPASVANEVDRAIENRASAEIATLRRKSYLDWLWNFGTLSPLMGLLGTATGISLTFADLKKSGADIDIQALSAGINEALWTTIGGLITGIVLMLIYYWFDNKLNEINSKWEYLYVDISEGL